MRLLTYMVDFLRAKGHTTPRLDPETQDTLLPAICARLEQAEAIFGRRVPDISTDGQRRVYTSCTIFLARILQFDLGFSELWTPTTKELIPRLTSTLLQLLLVRDLTPDDLNNSMLL